MPLPDDANANTQAAGTNLPAPLGSNALLAGAIGLTALLYLPVLRYTFVADDQKLIAENSSIRSWRHLPEYFQGEIWQNFHAAASGMSYRPLLLVLYRLNYALFGLNSMGWHACALLLHLIATALVFFIVRRLGQEPLIAAVAAVIFGVHPSHHEVVAWASGAAVSFGAVCFFASFLAYLKSREGHATGWMLSSIALAGAAVFANETGLVLPVVVLGHALVYGVHPAAGEFTEWRSRSWHALLRASAYLPACIVYAVARGVALNRFAYPQDGAGPVSFFLTLPSVLSFYLRQWLIPVRFSEFYDFSFQTHWNALHVGLPAMALGALAAFLWHYRWRFGAQAIAFAALAIFVMLAPWISARGISADEVLHDRNSYMAGLGAAFLAGLGFQPLLGGKMVFRLPQKLVLVLVAILIPLAYSAATAASYWSDDLTLLEHARAVAPQNRALRSEYASEMVALGFIGNAMPVLSEIVRDDPNSYAGNYGLGRALYEINLDPAAEHYLEHARDLALDNPEPYLQLGMISMKKGSMADAESDFRRAVTLRPSEPKFRFALGMALVRQGNCAAARDEFSQALRLDPTLRRAAEQRDKCEGEANAKLDQSNGTVATRRRVPLQAVKGRP